MRFTVLTLFPELFDPFFSHGMIGRAVQKKIIRAECVQIRDFADGRHQQVDDKPYGGGAGMVMKPEPLGKAVGHALALNKGARVVLLSPQGERFDQAGAEDLAGAGHGLILICGRYEGIDERIYSRYADMDLSIGDYVMTGGETAAMVVMESVSRLLPGVLGNGKSAEQETFAAGRLEYAQYTRPHEYDGMRVPEVLMSGNHERIEQWRLESSLRRTFMKRPDMFKKNRPSRNEKQVIRQWCSRLAALAGD